MPWQQLVAGPVAGTKSSLNRRDCTSLVLLSRQDESGTRRDIDQVFGSARTSFRTGESLVAARPLNLMLSLRVSRIETYCSQPRFEVGWTRWKGRRTQ